jgi:hypothetical protein
MLTMVTMMSTIWLHFGYSGTNVQVKNPLMQSRPATFGASARRQILGWGPAWRPSDPRSFGPNRMWDLHADTTAASTSASSTAAPRWVFPTPFEMEGYWVIYATRTRTVRPSAGRKHGASRSEGNTWKEGVNPQAGSVTLPQPGVWHRDETAVHAIARRGKTP